MEEICRVVRGIEDGEGGWGGGRGGYRFAAKRYFLCNIYSDFVSMEVSWWMGRRSRPESLSAHSVVSVTLRTVAGESQTADKGFCCIRNTLRCHKSRNVSAWHAVFPSL